jgi:hypothetical protein
MATILTNITNTRQTREEDALSGFFAGPGKWGVFHYLAGLAKEGQSNGYIHVDSSYNPMSKNAGFATLSGELAIINAPSTPGVVTRNGVGWIFLGNESNHNDLNNVSILTIAQFQSIVLDFINDLITNEDLTVTYQMGATMFDIYISWPM